MYETLNFEIRDRTAIITLARPKLMNALDEQSGPELIEALEQAGADDRVRVVILTGQGKAFSAGGNVRAMHQFLLDHPGQGAAAFFYRVVDALNRSILAIRQMDKPVIAALNGVAAGGGLGWALAADLVIAHPKVRLDTAYIRIGVNPDGGNTIFVPRRVGPQIASELFFLGRAMTAEEAQGYGLINRVVEPEKLLAEALSLAEELAGMDGAALARTKRLINDSVYYGLAEQLEKERNYILESADQPAFERLIKAFFSK